MHGKFPRRYKYRGSFDDFSHLLIRADASRHYLLEGAITDISVAPLSTQHAATASTASYITRRLSSVFALGPLASVYAHTLRSILLAVGPS